MPYDCEKKLQESFPWQRSAYHTDYNHVLALYKVKSCMENVSGKMLLDIACGDGLLTEMFAPNFQIIVGVDASSRHLAEARKRVPSGEFYESLIEDFEDDRKFDAVFMLDLLEHVQDPQAVLKKAAGFLKPNGRLIVHVPNCDAVNRKIAVLMGTLTSCGELSPFDVNVAGHRRSYNLASLEQEIATAGLKTVKMGGIFYKMLSTPQMDWLLKNGLWEAGHGWGRTGLETAKDWKSEFCRACYEYGLEHPEDCNIIYACIGKHY
ncbi:class I SAM-dependent methyltransferase [Desulfobotulus sp. H1]|uniref:Class I SAM-dependent methyltransferase n=1 Tax=Desulfobotulus pelophilus TaxID=2823377 RepID=A0ABT3NDY8_9BACT|nr:class I SAM-dependent methyltransferase [Desulfobotulus pelophilus]MCW7755401.1 class I SAM-dependent methyltransferase [Desulfobotulus pelophilus]